MRKIILKMHGYDYNIESYGYNINRNLGTEKGFADSISVSLGIIGKSNIDSLMLKDASDCVLTVYNDANMVVNEIMFNGQITSYNSTESEQAGYTSVNIHVHFVKYGDIDLKTKVLE